MHQSHTVCTPRASQVRRSLWLGASYALHPLTQPLNVDFRATQNPKPPARLKSIESAVLALTASQGKSGGPIRVSNEPCRL